MGRANVGGQTQRATWRAACEAKTRVFRATARPGQGGQRSTPPADLSSNCVRNPQRHDSLRGTAAFDTRDGTTFGRLEKYRAGCVRRSRGGRSGSRGTRRGDVGQWNWNWSSPWADVVRVEGCHSRGGLSGARSRARGSGRKPAVHSTLIPGSGACFTGAKVAVGELLWPRELPSFARLGRARAPVLTRALSLQEECWF